ncbi:MAG: nucleotide exchange factor GrpE, partial [Candidatus Obscuribacterales bacterium]|nr:nucleotide exchange factor GrpE [Candidatus Obscuribacterales bacterium]
MADDDKAKEQESQDSAEPPKKKQGEAGRKERDTAAKAFYRAMYAGAEPDPDEFGLKSGQDDEVSQADMERATAAATAHAKRLQQEVETLEARALEAENLYKRMAADFENFRKRTDRERQEFTAIGIQRAIEAILPALDDMDLAKSKLTDDVDSKNMMESLNMVYNRFARCLEQIGIAQLDVIGEPFDPRLHEPVQQIPTREVPDGSIVHQLRPGYIFNDKVLRPSLVNVATADGAVDLPPDSDEEIPETADSASDEENSADTENEKDGEGAETSTQDVPPVDSREEEEEE